MKLSQKIMLMGIALAMPFNLFSQVYDQSYYPDNYSGNVSQACCSESNISVEIDWLYWQLRGITAVGSQNIDVETSPSLEEREQKYYFPKGSHDSGIRLGLWYQKPCTCLNFGVIWTHIDSKAHKSLKPKTSNWIFQDGLSFGTPISNFDGSNHTATHLDYLDFDVSYKYELACCFTLTPHIGVRLFELDYSTRNKVVGIVSVEDPISLKTRWKSKDRAIGVEGGLEFAWKTPCYVTLFGHLGGSVLTYNQKFHENYQSIVSVEEQTTVFRQKNKFRSTTFMLNYALGLQYDVCICNRNIALRASWENVYLNYYNLEWQGLTLGAAFNF